MSAPWIPRLPIPRPSQATVCSDILELRVAHKPEFSQHCTSSVTRITHRNSIPIDLLRMNQCGQAGTVKTDEVGKLPM